MGGNCSPYRSWNTGDSFEASDITQALIVASTTNDTPQCMDDYSTDVTQMRATTDPFPSSTESLATSTAGELERLRYVIKKITGWGQWYRHTDAGTLNANTSIVRGVKGSNPSTTTYTVTGADHVVFYNPTTRAAEKVVVNQASLTVDATIQGRNGRDQSGAFASNTWLYLYYTWDGSTVALRLSTAAPPTGPTLANSETSYAFICALRWAAGAWVQNTTLRGNKVIYPARNSVLASGTATSFTAVSVSAAVPPDNVCYSYDLYHTVTGSVNAANSGYTLLSLLSLDGTNNWSQMGHTSTVGNSAPATVRHDDTSSMPNIGQSLQYRASVSVVTSPTVSLSVLSYDNANGG